MASFSDMTSWQNWSPTLARMYFDVSRSSPPWIAGAGSHRPMAIESLCWGLKNPSTRSIPLRVNANLVKAKKLNPFSCFSIWFTVKQKKGKGGLKTRTSWSGRNDRPHLDRLHRHCHPPSIDTSCNAPGGTRGTCASEGPRWCRSHPGEMTHQTASDDALCSGLSEQTGPLKQSKQCYLNETSFFIIVIQFEAW